MRPLILGALRRSTPAGVTVTPVRFGRTDAAALSAHSRIHSGFRGDFHDL